MSSSKTITQTKPLDLIKADVQSSRLTHAYLFAGPKGSGKKEAAKLLFSLANGHVEDCECSICRQTKNESHPDLSVVCPDGRFITIKQIRKEQHVLSLIPLVGKVKMTIITDAHAFNTESSNALLKTLEEPLENTVIVLLSSIPARLPATVRSRCRIVNFSSSTPKEVEDYLEENEVDPVKAVFASFIAGGIKREAMSLCNSESFWKDREKVVKDAVDIPYLRSDEALNVAEKFINAAKSAAKKEVTGTEKEAKETQLSIINQRLSIIQSVFRDAIFIKEGEKASAILNSDFFEAINKRLVMIDTSNLVGYIEKVEQTKRMLRQNANQLLAIQSLFLNVSEETCHK